MYFFVIVFVLFNRLVSFIQIFFIYIDMIVMADNWLCSYWYIPYACMPRSVKVLTSQSCSHRLFGQFCPAGKVATVSGGELGH